MGAPAPAAFPQALVRKRPPLGPPSPSSAFRSHCHAKPELGDPRIVKALILNLQPFLAHTCISAQGVRLTVEHNRAVPHDEDAVGDAHGNGQLLLNQ